MMNFRFIIVLFLGASPILIMAQSKKKLNVEGDFYYDTENYIEAEEFYTKSVEKKHDFQSLYNLGNTQEKQAKIEEAIDNYSKALPFASDDIERSIAHYNIGNTLFSDKELDIEKLESVITHYKDAIRLNSNLQEAKHNLASAQIALDTAKQQEQQEQQQQEDQNQEQKEQEDQEQKDQEDKPDENKQEDDQQKNQDQQKQSAEEKEQQKQSVDEKEIENILKMVEKEDAEVQQKMRKQSKTDQKTKKKKW